MLIAGRSTSCGCFQAEQVAGRSTTHGIYGTPLYWSIFGNEKRARKLFAMPPWTDYYEMKAIYQNRPPGNHVDHIIPLVHDMVCGLHCPANLQYLPAGVNCSKKNHFVTDWDLP